MGVASGHVEIHIAFGIIGKEQFFEAVDLLDLIENKIIMAAISKARIDVRTEFGSVEKPLVFVQGEVGIDDVVLSHSKAKKLSFEKGRKKIGLSHFSEAGNDLDEMVVLLFEKPIDVIFPGEFFFHALILSLFDIFMYIHVFVVHQSRKRPN